MAEHEAAPKEETKKKGGSSLILIIIIIVLLLGGAAGFLFFTPMGNKIIGKHPETEHQQETAPKDLVFFSLPELTINLSAGPKVKKAPFLKLMVKLELATADDAKTMELIKPRIIDRFQIYLRGLRIEDLEGTQGMQRLSDELMKRVNEVSAPIKIKNVLFENFLVQ